VQQRIISRLHVQVGKSYVDIPLRRSQLSNRWKFRWHSRRWFCGEEVISKVSHNDKGQRHLLSGVFSESRNALQFGKSTLVAHYEMNVSTRTHIDTICRTLSQDKGRCLLVQSPQGVGLSADNVSSVVSNSGGNSNVGGCVGSVDNGCVHLKEIDRKSVRHSLGNKEEHLICRHSQWWLR
jgi:hypothetical protein